MKTLKDTYPDLQQRYAKADFGGKLRFFVLEVFSLIQQDVPYEACRRILEEEFGGDVFVELYLGGLSFVWKGARNYRDHTVIIKHLAAPYAHSVQIKVANALGQMAYASFTLHFTTPGEEACQCLITGIDLHHKIEALQSPQQVTSEA